MALVIKDPDARIEFAMDWGDDFLATLEILTAEWVIAPESDPPLTVLAQSHAALACRVTLAGGAMGATYRVTNRVTMSDGQIDDRSLTVRVEQR